MNNKEEETNNNQNQGKTNNSADISKIKSFAKKLLIVVGIFVALFLIVSIVEQQFRLSNPDSAYRPSNVLEVVFDYASWVYETIGYYAGFILDFPEWVRKIWRFIKRFFPVEDMTLIASHLWEIVFVSPFYAVKGFFEYYGKHITIPNIDPIAAMLFIFILSLSVGGLWAASQAPGNPGNPTKIN